MPIKRFYRLQRARLSAAPIMLRPTPSKRVRILRFLLLLLLLSAATALGGWFGWSESERRLKETFMGQFERVVELESALASEVAMRQLIQQQLVIEKTTRSMLERELGLAQAEAASRQESLTFLDSLLTSNDRTRAIRLVACELQGLDARRYRYRALLAQGANRDEEYRGRLIASVDFMQKGRRGRVASGEDKPLVVKVKHYERVEGEVILPADAYPQALDVRIVSMDGRMLAAQCHKKLEG